ncbi:aminopeptidase N-like [Nylanderia fulva]|uniref:aminopeptidase N-like n=1 Tax=Nylanderia fulva TaxID=613905 RepID=UPI0010FB748B|nr:aminopeptidase N-like [Nylanderia fulva]
MVSGIETRTLFLLLLLNSGLLFIGASTVNENLRNDCSIGLNYRLPNHVIPKLYYVKLWRPNEIGNRIRSFSNEIKIKINILEPTQNISLHAHHYLKIHQSMLTKKSDMNVYKPLKYKYCNKTEIMTLYFESTLSRGNYTLDINFNNDLMMDAFYFSTDIKEGEINEGPLFVSSFNAVGARRMFPCWDEPKFTAAFHISVCHGSNYMVASNTLLHKRYPDKNNTEWLWSVFETTPKMPTYLLAVMYYPDNGERDIRKSPYIWGREHLDPYVQFAVDVKSKVNEHFTGYSLNVFYPPGNLEMILYALDTLNVLIPGYLYDDIDNNWWLVFYREIDFIYDEEIDPVAHKTKVAYLIARKLAHQWFCNLVSPSWWSDLWLNEGVAILFAIDAVDKILINSQMLDLFVVQVQHDSLYLDSSQFSYQFMLPLISRINNMSEINSLSFSRYIKAPAIMRMLQLIITKEVFQHGISIYLRRNMLKSATLDDFWTAMQTALDESLVKDYSFNVSEKMDAWLKYRHYPVINVKQDNSTHVTVSLTKSSMNSWWIPVTITTETIPYFEDAFILDGKWINPHNFNCTFSLLYEEYGWIIANIKQFGYYRVNYDYENWQKIANYLSSPKYSEIHVLNRAQIIDDAFYFVTIKKLRPAMFWKLAYYLSQEKEYIAWYPMIKAIERMSCIFPLADIHNIKRKIMYILDALLKEITYVEDSNDSDNIKTLRQESVKWACILGLNDCISMAKQTFYRHLLNPKEHKILPSWKEWTYCNGLKGAKSHVFWSKVINLWKTTHDNNILKSLTCIKQKEVSNMLIYLALHKKHEIFALSVKDRINLYFIIIAKHIKNNKMLLENILKKFEILKPREVSTTTALTHIINHVYSKDQLEKIKKFVDKIIKQQSSDFHHKLELRRSQIKQLKNYFSYFKI